MPAGPMIIYRAFGREAVRNTIAVTLVLAIVMGFLAITALLARTVRGDIAQDIVMQLLGLQTLKRFDLLLTLGLYLGVLLTASRWYRDNEMTVLAACGIGLAQMLRPMLIVMLVVAAVIAGFGFYFSPWAARSIDRLMSERQQQRQPVNVAPGVFNETSGGARVFYAERVERESGAIENVFISSIETGRESVIVAQSGYPYIEPRTGDRFLALVNGTQYEGTPGAAEYRLLKFKTLRVRVEPKNVEAPPPKTDAMPSGELYRQTDPAARAQWHWRLSKPVMAAVLVLFALVLSYTNPRQGRLSNLFAAVLVYFIYSNVLALGQTLIKKGVVPGSFGLWWVHLVMLAIAAHFFRQRALNRPLWALPSWRG